MLLCGVLDIFSQKGKVRSSIPGVRSQGLPGVWQKSLRAGKGGGPIKGTTPEGWNVYTSSPSANAEVSGEARLAFGVPSAGLYRFHRVQTTCSAHWVPGRPRENLTFRMSHRWGTCNQDRLPGGGQSSLNERGIHTDSKTERIAWNNWVGQNGESGL